MENQGLENSYGHRQREYAARTPENVPAGRITPIPMRIVSPRTFGIPDKCCGVDRAEFKQFYADMVIADEDVEDFRLRHRNAKLRRAATETTALPHPLKQTRRQEARACATASACSPDSNTARCCET